MDHTVPNRIHPLMAVAAFSLTLVSLVGAASILGLLPNSQAKNGGPTEMSAAATPAPQIGSPFGAPLTAQLQPQQPQQFQQQPQQFQQQPQLQQQPVQQPRVVEHRTIVHHTYAPARQTSRDDNPPRVAQAPQQAAPQNSAVGIGLGAVVGGLLGNQVGGGRGKTIATIAGAMGGAYAGNEIAKRNQQQP